MQVEPPGTDFQPERIGNSSAYGLIELWQVIAPQPGEVVVAEKIDRISRLPLAEAEQLVSRIRATGAKLAVPGLVDLSDFAAEADGNATRFNESGLDCVGISGW